MSAKDDSAKREVLLVARVDVEERISSGLGFSTKNESGWISSYLGELTESLIGDDAAHEVVGVVFDEPVN